MKKAPLFILFVVFLLIPTVELMESDFTPNNVGKICQSVSEGYFTFNQIFIDEEVEYWTSVTEDSEPIQEVEEYVVPTEIDWYQIFINICIIGFILLLIAFRGYRPKYDLIVTRTQKDLKRELKKLRGGRR